MNAEWIESFHTREEARDKNYHLCKYCAPMGKYYRAEFSKIKGYASENGLIFDYYDNSISVCTPYSQWKIIVSGRKKGIFLYHKNIYRKSADNSLVPGYHSQAVKRKSIVEVREVAVIKDEISWERNYVRQEQVGSDSERRSWKTIQREIGSLRAKYTGDRCAISQVVCE